MTRPHDHTQRPFPLRWRQERRRSSMMQPKSVTCSSSRCPRGPTGSQDKFRSESKVDRWFRWRSQGAKTHLRAAPLVRVKAKFTVRFPVGLRRSLSPKAISTVTLTLTSRGGDDKSHLAISEAKDEKVWLPHWPNHRCDRYLLDKLVDDGLFLAPEYAAGSQHKSKSEG